MRCLKRMIIDFLTEISTDRFFNEILRKERYYYEYDRYNFKAV